ncbi:hydroxymethylpyrimidine/phosphomethylpyrimidine kinase [Leuconostoc litchii]|uniref:pyridoxal kinase n=1 Tax=Leuconostoc litchii TaxID=1981069 RepID=A0A6P2CKK0_9LACO|nr:hydroxymethylpyrimidine/phosphomethylpyrimidine kinase [Leuconostoc litchii]TYC46259.1 hydroxymethylpyrimidine/phosphomethylpyrimidine kinase [Leuconostoc litchii]GMA69970.1 hydroxymethylpyrimidine/phosphomethylpyrimidine kinase [Leuconostoc litchii]
MKKILSIGGSDTSGGGGIQADIKTFERYNKFNIVAIENIVTMSPNTWGVKQYPTPNQVFSAQLQTSLAVDLAGIKIGMISNMDNFNTLIDYLETANFGMLLVDPVMVTKVAINNDQMVNLETYKKQLLSKADIITPNVLEAAMLTNVPAITNISEMKIAAKKLYSGGIKYVVIKSGNRFADHVATDLLYDGAKFELFQRETIDTNFNHGAGCTFSAAILANLVENKPIIEAVQEAKEFTFQTIDRSIKLNKFVGHVWQGDNNYETTQ